MFVEYLSGEVLSNVGGSLPRQLKLISIISINFLGLTVHTLNNIAVSEVPPSDTLWLVVVEVTFEVRAVWVLPLPAH